MDNKWMIANIFIFICLVVFAIGLIKVEIRDNKEINSYYKNVISKKNKECMSYLQTINLYPYWRITFFAGYILAIFTTYYLFLILSIKNISKKQIFWLFFWFTSLFNTYFLYKFLTLWNWHYVTNNGGAKNILYSSNFYSSKKK